eukprot:9999819-Ditylum_brightwellii.AAC.1
MSNSRKSSNNELTRRQHKCKKKIKETKKARNLRDTTIESFFNKKREGRSYLKRVKRKGGVESYLKKLGMR